MSKQLFRRQNYLLLMTTFISLLSINQAAEAASITFDASIGEVHNVSNGDELNRTATLTNNEGYNTLNQYNTPNQWFSSDFLLLGADPNTDSNIFEDSYRVGVSTAISQELSLQEIKDNPVLSFDWSFQGNSDKTLTISAGDLGGASLGLPNFDLDTFKISLVNVGGGVDLDLFQRANADYGSNRREEININDLIELNNLEVGSYTINATVVETFNIVNTEDVALPQSSVTDDAVTNISPVTAPIATQFVVQNAVGSDSSSAAGIGNMTLSAEVPFEFSPSQGLFLVAGFWGLFFYIKRRKKEIANQELSLDDN